MGTHMDAKKIFATGSQQYQIIALCKGTSQPPPPTPLPAPGPDDDDTRDKSKGKGSTGK